MTREEINRYIHVEIMGKCWHEPGKYPSSGLPKQICVLCGFDPQKEADEKNAELGEEYFYACSLKMLRPNYCSSDSPRRLLDEVVVKVDGLGFYHELLERLEDVHGVDLGASDDIWCDGGKVFRSTAEQIATACVKAHRDTLQAMEKENRQG